MQTSELYIFSKANREFFSFFLEVSLMNREKI